MARNQRAHKTKAGYNFQDLAAIVLFIDNFDNLKSIKAEGNNEDIDVQLLDGTWKFAQAKMISDPLNSDKRYRRRRMSEAYTSLCNNFMNSSDAVSKIIYVSNCEDPLGEKDKANSSIYGISTPIRFDQLAQTTQDRVEKMLSNKIKKQAGNNHIDTQQLDKVKKAFEVKIIPFDPQHRYEDKFGAVQQYVGNFLSSRKLSKEISLIVMRNWHDLIRENSESYATDSVLLKKDFLWVIVVIEFNQPFVNDNLAFKLNLDSAIMDEVSDKFGEILDYINEHFEFCSAIWNDKDQYENKLKSKGKRLSSYIYSFVNDSWQDYKDKIKLEDASDEENEALVKLALYRILTKQNMINKIKGI